MIGAGIASVFVKDSSWTEAAVIITLGIGFLFAPDKK